MRRNYADKLLHFNTGFFSVLLFLLLPRHSTAQLKGNNWTIAAGMHFPVAVFSATHFPGAGIKVEYSDNRFGQFPATLKKKLGYILSTGIDHYFGRTEKTGGYSFTYGGYSIFQLYGGVICNTGKKANINLVAGPALSRYNGTTRFNIGSNLSATYFLSRKWGISPSMMMIVETGASPLWSGSLKASRTF